MGMAKAAIDQARQLIDAPEDPQYTSGDQISARPVGLRALGRVLLKFERWDEILDASKFPWSETFADQTYRHYYEARVWLAKNDLDKAEKSIRAHDALKKDADKNKGWAEIHRVMAEELKARIKIARGETLEGLGLLATAAKDEAKIQEGYADPPFYPVALYNDLGEAYLAAESPALAIKAFIRRST